MSIDNAKSECLCNMLELQYNTLDIGLGMGGTAITGGYDKEWLFAVYAFISVGLDMDITGGYDYIRWLWGWVGHARHC